MTSSPPPRRSVALLIETSNGYARGVLAGITGYLRQNDAWSIYMPEQERVAVPPEWLSRWRGDGIIARIETSEMADAIAATGVPVVDVSAARHLPNVPWVETDDRSIARLAIDHIVERGFKQVAYCGDPGFRWSVLRREAFEAEAHRRGLQHHGFDSLSRLSDQYSWPLDQESLRQWIGSLPLPIAILGCYDIKAQQLLTVCRQQSISVPEQIAILGVDNDELLCNLSDPPLSSIASDTRRTGWQAAALLDRLMSPDPPPVTGPQLTRPQLTRPQLTGPQLTGPQLIEPLGVVARQSTDIMAIEDDDVVSTLRYIRKNACRGIDVSDVMRQTTLSRRMLERRFVKLLGRTPHQEINRIRINRVRQLLAETELTLYEIADLCGFVHEEYLSVAFKKQTGQTPTQFRRQHQ